VRGTRMGKIVKFPTQKRSGESVESIDHFFEYLRQQSAEDVDAAFEYHDEINNPDFQTELFNNLFQPGMDDFYNTLAEEMDNIGEGHELLHENKDDVKAAVAKALKSYFEKVNPAVLESLEGVDEKDHYDILSKHFERTHVDLKEGKTVSIDAIVKSMVKDKKKTIGQFKTSFYNQRGYFAGAGMGHLVHKAGEHYFGKFHSHEIAAYIKPKLDERGIEIEDLTKFATLDTGELIPLGSAAKYDEWTDIKYEKFGLKPMERVRYEDRDAA